MNMSVLLMNRTKVSDALLSGTLIERSDCRLESESFARESTGAVDVSH